MDHLSWTVMEKFSSKYDVTLKFCCNFQILREIFFIAVSLSLVGKDRKLRSWNNSFADHKSFIIMLSGWQILTKNTLMISKCLLTKNYFYLKLSSNAKLRKEKSPKTQSKFSSSRGSVPFSPPGFAFLWNFPAPFPAQSQRRRHTVQQ